MFNSSSGRSLPGVDGEAEGDMTALRPVVRAVARSEIVWRLTRLSAETSFLGDMIVSECDEGKKAPSRCNYDRRKGAIGCSSILWRIHITA